MMTHFDADTATREELLEAISDLQDEMYVADEGKHVSCEGCSSSINFDDVTHGLYEVYCADCARVYDDEPACRCGRLIAPGDHVVVGREPYTKELIFTHEGCMG